MESGHGPNGDCPAALQVEQHISNFLRMDDSGAAARATRAVLHWQNPTLAAAFSTWLDAAAAQLTDRTNELKAAKFLQLALVLKALTGFKWAVQEASVDRAAAGHRGAAVKRAVLKGWRQVAWYLQVCASLLSLAFLSGSVCVHRAFY